MLHPPEALSGYFPREPGAGSRTQTRHQHTHRGWLGMGEELGLWYDPRTGSWAIDMPQAEEIMKEQVKERCHHDAQMRSATMVTTTAQAIPPEWSIGQHGVVVRWQSLATPPPPPPGWLSRAVCGCVWLSEDLCVAVCGGLWRCVAV